MLFRSALANFDPVFEWARPDLYCPNKGREECTRFGQNVIGHIDNTKWFFPPFVLGGPENTRSLSKESRFVRVVEQKASFLSTVYVEEWQVM